ncbi:MAG: permease [Candidatus Hydrogenedens sp.]|nr:permease [Candidatus Hydrogenedens sp.]
MELLTRIVQQIIMVAGQMSPYLLFGFVVAGILHVVLSPEWMRHHLGGRGVLPVFKSVLLGVPLPLCSCGVIAVTASMRKQGAGKGAAVGFLIATPQTGVDSIMATWGMLGPFLGLFRPFVALVTGMIGGTLVALTSNDEKGEEESADEQILLGERPPRTLREIFRYGLVELPRDIAKPLLIGVLLAGAITAAIPQDMLAPYLGGGLLAMVIMTFFGMPIYICATAAIPLALSFIHMGASPGAALAFLIAGPAANSASIATVWEMMGKKATAVYVLTVGIGAILAGLFFDTFLTSTNLIHSALNHEHSTGGIGRQIFFGTLMTLVLINSLWGRKISIAIRSLFRSAADKAAMEKIDIAIEGMTCMRCVGAVEKRLAEIPGISEVHVELSSGQAQLYGKDAAVENILDVVKELGYQATVRGSS